MKLLNSPLGIFVQRCIMLMLIPLIGWGIDDTKGFLENYNRAGLLLIALLMNGYVAYDCAKRRIPKNTKRKIIINRQHIVVVLFQSIVSLLLIAIPFFARRNLFVFGTTEWVQLIGLLLFSAGIFIIYETKKYLGLYFSGEAQLIENHKLLTGGFYKYIRHPRYLGELMFMAGFSLVFNVWMGFIFTLILFLVLLWRIRDEEKMLHGEFGKKWEEYSAATKKLLPFIY